MAKCSQCGKDVSLFDRDLFTGTCRECRSVGARPATLGCGTLIVIGIVVALSTRSGFQNIEQKLTKIERSVDSLQTVLSQQTAEIRQLRTALEAQKSGTAKTR